MNPRPQAHPTEEARGSSDYRTIAEVAEQLRVTAKRLRNMMAAGVFVEGYHFFRRPGFGPRFRWSRVVEWLETTPDNAEDSIPMAGAKRRSVAVERHTR